MLVNVWLGIRNDAQTAIEDCLDWDDSAEYSGPVGDREKKIFQAMSDRAVVQRLFNKATINSNLWNLWTVYFDEPKDILIKIKNELDYLEDTYPTQFVIGAAWFWDGRQVGTQYTYDEDGVITGITGTPTYPAHPKLIDFMPDVWNGDDPATYSTATQLTDVNLLAGQTPRRF